jgi:hypothetical protein
MTLWQAYSGRHTTRNPARGNNRPDKHIPRRGDITPDLRSVPRAESDRPRLGIIRGAAQRPICEACLAENNALQIVSFLSHAGATIGGEAMARFRRLVQGA